VSRLVKIATLNRAVQLSCFFDLGLQIAEGHPTHTTKSFWSKVHAFQKRATVTDVHLCNYFTKLSEFDRAGLGHQKLGQMWVVLVPAIQIHRSQFLAKAISLKFREIKRSGFWKTR
jgi:hypothetical protein